MNHERTNKTIPINRNYFPEGKEFRTNFYGMRGEILGFIGFCSVQYKTRNFVQVGIQAKFKASPVNPEMSKLPKTKRLPVFDVAQAFKQ